MTIINTLLSVEGLVVRSNETALAGPVSFTLKQGETLGIVGESGSGKTLTAMAIAGLLPQSLHADGQSYLDGAPLALGISDRGRDFRTSQIGVVFQNPTTALNPRLSVGAQLFEALSPAMRGDKAKAATICLHLLEEVGISEPVKKLTAWPHELSGGLAQRVVIAMALARQPKLLIADEPTTALDVTVQAQILDLIARLQKRHGFGVLLITHDMGVIRDRADSVAVMDGGAIVESGATLNLLQIPRAALRDHF
ncbi:dipeptide/oligopeptide/nickel ABC transporter ATP-binding protein [Brucella pseudogrignonensis]|nr:dipeptide/oligopeptide/nickel ABC transporter ATP-binding protein [Brucella pseudogrignonensis]